MLIERDGRWLAEASRGRAASRRRACSAATSPSRSSTARSARTARSRGCSSASTSPTSAPACSPPRYDRQARSSSACCADRGMPQVDFCEVGAGRLARAGGRAIGYAALGQAVAARLQRRDPQGHRARRPRRGDRAARSSTIPRVIVEAHCAGREVECSVLGNAEPEASLPGRDRDRRRLVRLRGQVRARAAWSWSSRPTRRRGDRAGPELAVEVFAACGCTGLARCDFFVDGDGEVLVNELNTIPGFTETSVFAKLFEAIGDRLPGALRPPVELAVERHQSERGYSF